MVASCAKSPRSLARRVGRAGLETGRTSLVSIALTALLAKAAFIRVYLRLS
jgi:hypothetical protein